MKKLAFITTHPIQYHAPLYELLTRRGHLSLKVFYTWGESVLKDKYDPGFGKVVEWDIPLLKGYDFTFLENISTDKGSHHFNGIINPDIIRTIQAYQPDAVLVYGWSFSSHLKLMRAFKGRVPVLFRGDSTLLDEAGGFSRLKRRLFLRWVYRYIDYALYVGKNNADYFLKAGLKERQLVFGPHAIDNDRFACVDDMCLQQASSFRKQLGIPEDHAVFLFAGKFEAKKAPDLLLTAFMEAAMGDSVHLVMTGNGQMQDELKAMSSGNPSVHFLDFQNQAMMPALYRMANIFVLPSRGPGETWGLAVNEAMACGLPVVVSDKCGCAPDLVKEGLNGYIFRSMDRDALKARLREMIAKRKEWAKMGTKSREIIQEYSLERLAESIENLVDRC